MEKARHRFPDGVFATSLIEPGMRAVAYRRWLRPIALIEASGDEPVDASIVTYRLGRMTLSRSTSSAARYLRDEAIIAKSHFKDCLLLRLLVAGNARGVFGGDRTEIRAGDIYLSDLAQPSELLVQGECMHINVMMHRSEAGDLPVHGRVLHGEWLPCHMLREHLLNFIEVLQHCSAASLKEMINATMELIRFCLRTDGASNDADHFDESRERIVEYIDQHLHDGDLGALRLQQVFGVSRSQLYRQFAELGGVQHYIRNKRLQSVLRDLCNEPQLSITEIIERHGFSNERQFQRAFRARFGMTASEARAGWKSSSPIDPFDDPVD
jgi:AraC-like DNA-binding protein